jgi:hypothetical protein
MGTLSLTIPQPITATKLRQAVLDIVTAANGDGWQVLTNSVLDVRTTQPTLQITTPAWTFNGQRAIKELPSKSRIYAVNATNIQSTTVNFATYVGATGLAFTNTGATVVESTCDIAVTDNFLMYARSATEIGTYVVDGAGALTGSSVNTTVTQDYMWLVQSRGYFFGLSRTDGNIYRIDINGSGAVTGEVSLGRPSWTSGLYPGFLAGNNKRLYYLGSEPPTDQRMASVQINSDGTFGAWENEKTLTLENTGSVSLDSHPYWNQRITTRTSNTYNPIKASEDYVYIQFGNISTGSAASTYKTFLMYLNSTSGKIEGMHTSSSSSTTPLQNTTNLFINNAFWQSGSGTTWYGFNVSQGNMADVVYNNAGTGKKMAFSVLTPSATSLFLVPVFLSSDNTKATYCYGNFSQINGAIQDSSGARFGNTTAATSYPALLSTLDISIVANWGTKHLAITMRQGVNRQAPFIISTIDIFKNGSTPINIGETWGYPQWGATGHPNTSFSGGYNVGTYTYQMRSLDGLRLTTPNGGLKDTFIIVSPFFDYSSSSQVTSGPVKLSPDYGGELIQTRQNLARGVVNTINGLGAISRGFFSEDDAIMLAADTGLAIEDTLTYNGNTYRVFWRSRGSSASSGFYDLIVRQ